MNSNLLLVGSLSNLIDKSTITSFVVLSSLELNFLSTSQDTAEPLNTIYLYPNQYITFNPARNILIK